MNHHRLKLSPAVVAPCLLIAAFFTGCETTATSPNASAPATTPQGLVKVDRKGQELVYLRPGANFSAYDQFMIIEPAVAYRKDWRSDQNAGRAGVDKITDADMQRMIAKGKELLVEEFSAALTKGGYKLATAPGPNVLAVKPSLYDVDVFAPDPDGTANLGGRTMSDGAGAATIALDLSDSVSGQLLAQAFDRKSDSGSSYNWSVSRTQSSNISDASYAFGQWAKMLVKGLDHMKAAGAAPAAPATK